MRTSYQQRRTKYVAPLSIYPFSPMQTTFCDVKRTFCDTKRTFHVAKCTFHDAKLTFPPMKTIFVQRIHHFYRVGLLRFSLKVV